VECVIFTLLVIISILFCTEHHDHHSHDHTHDPGVSSVSIVCEGSLDLEKVRHGVYLMLSVSNSIFHLDVYGMSFILLCTCKKSVLALAY